MRPWYVPTERQAVTLGLFAFALFLVGDAHYQPDLWKEDAFKSILQAVVITGLLNMVGAFHFAANKSDETKSENTRAAFAAIEATANASASPQVETMNVTADTANVETKP